MKNGLTLLLFALAFIATACGTREVAAPATVQVTVPATVPVTVPVTVVVTATPSPEPTATPTPAASQVEAVAANFVGTQEQGGVTIQLVRVLCSSAQEFMELYSLAPEEFEEEYGGPQTMCEFILEVSNTADSMLSVYPDQGVVIIGDEQIDLSPFSVWSLSDLGDVSGDLYPGVRRVGGFWFPVSRTAWNEIVITYIISAPFGEDLAGRGDDFRFEIDTTSWGCEPLPDDLS